jgi:hypothetical protein
LFDFHTKTIKRKPLSKKHRDPRETSQEEKHRPQSKKSPLLPPPRLTAPPLPLLLLPHTLFFLPSGDQLTTETCFKEKTQFFFDKASSTKLLLV